MIAGSQVILNVFLLQNLDSLGVIIQLGVPEKLIWVHYALLRAVKDVILSSFLLGEHHKDNGSLGSDSVHYKGGYDDYEH